MTTIQNLKDNDDNTKLETWATVSTWMVDHSSVDVDAVATNNVKIPRKEHRGLKNIIRGIKKTYWKVYRYLLLWCVGNGLGQLPQAQGWTFTSSFC